MKSNNSISIFDIDYQVIAETTVNIVDSFVAPANKKGSGSGEARLYVSSQSQYSFEPLMQFDNNFPIIKGNRTYAGCPLTCYVSKENIQNYMSNIQHEYLYPSQQYRQNISLLYPQRLSKVNEMHDFVPFHVYNQNGSEDIHRFYIGSANPVWDFIRELCLPNITYIKIYKLRANDEFSSMIYYFELHSSNETVPPTIDTTLTHSEKIISYINTDDNIDATVKESLIKARIGQGNFRTNVLNIMPCCPFTGISMPCLLRASHIIPWVRCTTTYDRLNGYNGLTLSPTYDLLFDLGLISFENNGALLISPLLPQNVVNSLNLIQSRIYNIVNNTGERNNYLDYHRNVIFKRQ